MRRLAGTLLLALSMTAALAGGLTKEQQRIFALDKCNAGGGCFYWDSRQCLWHNEDGAGPFLLPGTLNVQLKEVVTSGGARHFEAPG
jgi:hypothetical protein